MTAQPEAGDRVFVVIRRDQLHHLAVECGMVIALSNKNGQLCYRADIDGKVLFAQLTQVFWSLDEANLYRSKLESYQ